LVLSFAEAAASRLARPRPKPGDGGPVASKRWASPLDLACDLDPFYVRTPALELINEALVWAHETPDARLMVWMSPQEGKSELCSHWGPLWSLIQSPTRRIGLVSYADALARRWGRKVRNDIRDHARPGAAHALGLELAPDLQAANEWETTARGGFVTAGIHSGLTGRPVDDLRIDDPLKDRDEADSQTIRDNCWEFWTGTAVPRLAPGAPATLVMTRWHHDDLAGRLLKDQPGRWRVVHIPAQADPQIVDPDPLGRAPGEFMASARGRTREDWELRKSEMGADWAPLAQGHPTDPGGQTFDPDRLHWWTLTPDGRGIAVGGGRVWLLSECRRFVTIDTATSTRGTADYTVASAWAVPPDGTLILLDVRRDRVPEHRQIELARPLAQRWRVDCVYVEATMAGTRLVRDAVAAGIRIDDLKADRGKTVRNAPAAKWMEQGRISFPAPASATALPADLLKDVLEELRQFPAGRHDDFVDTLGYAVAVVMDTYLPPDSGRDDPGVVAARERVAVVERAVAEGPVDDWMTRPM
jgi:predicted phage terminase large subunit-like protein